MELGRKSITWTAIRKYDDNGTTLYLCDSIIRHMAFSEYGNNNWEESDIRRWVNYHQPKGWWIQMQDQF